MNTRRIPLLRLLALVLLANAARAIQEPDAFARAARNGQAARTTAMYCLWKTQGVTAHPWREDLAYGAVLEDGVLYLSIDSERPWSGRIHFDQPRHRTQMHLPLDYPRINPFPEWFTVEATASYKVCGVPGQEDVVVMGAELVGGLALDMASGEAFRLTVRPVE